MTQSRPRRLPRQHFKFKKPAEAPREPPSGLKRTSLAVSELAATPCPELSGSERSEHPHTDKFASMHREARAPCKGEAPGQRDLRAAAALSLLRTHHDQIKLSVSRLRAPLMQQTLVEGGEGGAPGNKCLCISRNCCNCSGGDYIHHGIATQVISPGDWKKSRNSASVCILCLIAIDPSWKNTCAGVQAHVLSLCRDCIIFLLGGLC